MHLRGVDLTLDDVEDGDVAVGVLLVRGPADHHVLVLEEAAHHVEDGRAADLQSKDITVKTAIVCHVTWISSPKCDRRPLW